METIYKTTSFGAIEIGAEFEFAGRTSLVGPEPGRKYIKASARKATSTSGSFNVPAGDRVRIVDGPAMAERAAFLAKPLFDGTEASCRNRQEYYALDAALRDVVDATEKLDAMADYVARKMADIKARLRREGAVELKRENRWDRQFVITPASAAAWCGLNSCGELQGNGNVDMLVVELLMRREAFVKLVHALGYRVTKQQEAL